MSAYYGTLRSDKGTTTRAGQGYMNATAQSYNGSVRVVLQGDRVSIYAERGSTADPSICLGTFSLAALTSDDAPSLKLV